MKNKCLRILILSLFLILTIFTSQLIAQDENNVYFQSFRTTLDDGKSIDEIIIMGPPERPQGFESTQVQLPEPNPAAGVNVLSNVPAFDWSFGCSATSAAMIAGYYDRTGYPNMYSGPTNGGVMPMDNSSWPDWWDGYDWRHQCPLSATHNGLDERAVRGTLMIIGSSMGVVVRIHFMVTGQSILMANVPAIT